jgi:hypothetical protein
MEIIVLILISNSPLYEKSIEKNKANLESKTASILPQIEESIAQNNQTLGDETPV